VQAVDELPGDVEDDMSGRNEQTKARNQSRVAEVLPHSEGVAYNQQGWEIATCP